MFDRDTLHVVDMYQAFEQIVGECCQEGMLVRYSQTIMSHTTQTHTLLIMVDINDRTERIANETVDMVDDMVDDTAGDITHEEMVEVTDNQVPTSLIEP